MEHHTSSPESSCVRATHEIEAWLIDQVARRSNRGAEEIHRDRSLSAYGLDSLSAIELSGDLERWLGFAVPPTLAYEHPTIADLARHLSGVASNAPVAASRSGHAAAVAIVGMACRFPRAPGTGELWQLLRDGVDAISEVPAGRWPSNLAALDHARRGGFLEAIDGFDASFFGISNDEAQGMDPQQRLLLELTVEALEDAGQDATSLRGSRTGVFVGISNNDYIRVLPRNRHAQDLFWTTGNALSIAANRISYQLDLRGPSVAIDTACSSSLVAVHLALNAMHAGDCGLALVGGVNLIVSPEVSINFAYVGAASPSGQCRAFDAGADGMVRGEGGGVVVLKPLASARADGDRIHAVILGSAVNQDGRTNGLAAPNRQAQEAVVREALSASGLRPRDIHYVETHGTGTLLGDPIEARALGEVLGAGRDVAAEPCWIGSVKTNIGHLEAAAGIAGLIKTALAVSNREIPPHLHFRRGNPYINFGQLGLRVPSRLTPWPAPARARAGVSAFGFGGTNAHVILEEPPTQPSHPSRPDPPYVLPISASGDRALAELTVRYEEHLSVPMNDTMFHDVCAAAAIRRTHHGSRAALVCRSPEDARDRLRELRAGKTHPCVCRGSVQRPLRQPVFVYSGFAAERDGVGDDCVRRSDAFREATDECLALLAIDPEAGPLVSGQARMFALQVALTSLYASLGITPGAVVGYSMGEVTAAYVAGALPLPDAVRVVSERSRLLQHAENEAPASAGGMVVVRTSEESMVDLLAAFNGRLSVAGVNSPEQLIVSGESGALADFLQDLRVRRIAFRRIDLPGAGHAPQLHSLAQSLLGSLENVHARRPDRAMYSTVTGTRAEDPPGAAHWARNLSQPVLFSGAIRAAVFDGFTDFIEIGPDATLISSVIQILNHAGRQGHCVASLRRGADEWTAICGAIAALYVRGHSVAWTGLYGPRPAFVALPRNPWQRSRCWFAEGAETNQVEPKRSARTFFSQRLDAADPPGYTYWQGTLALGIHAWVDGHRIQGTSVLTSAAYLAAALDAADALLSGPPCSLDDVDFRRALFLPPSGSLHVQLAVSNAENGTRVFRVASRTSDARDWVTHAVGTMRAHDRENDPVFPNLATVLADRRDVIRPDVFYAGMRSAGVEYGPVLQGLQEIWRTTDGAVARVALPSEAAAGLRPFAFHPALLDACLQTLAAAGFESRVTTGTVLPVGTRRMICHRAPVGRLWSYARLTSSPSTADLAEGEVRIFDESGAVIADVEGFRVRRMDAARIAAGAPSCYNVCWEPIVNMPRSELAAGCWWIVGSGEMATELAGALQAAGHGIATGAVALETNIEGASGACLGVVYLGTDNAGVTADDLESKLLAECSALLVIVRSLASQHRPPRLWIVTRGAQALEGDHNVSIAQAPLWGLARTLAQERPACWGGAIDLDPAASFSENAASLCRALLRNDAGPSGREDQVAVRGTRWYGARLHRADLTSACGSQPPRLRTDATYLITGGLGDLGLVVARWLVDCGARHLLLIGRTPMPPRREWTACRDERTARRIRDVLAIEARGASVQVVAADVADYRALRSRLDEVADEARPPIRGVLHLAGDVHGSPLVALSPNQLLADLRPKAMGAWNLHRYFGEAALDFLVLFSSGASILGSPFLGAYAAGSAFLDGLAHARRCRGAHALSINWGFWRETGMAARQLREHGREAPHGMQGFDNAEGLDLLQGVWSWRGAQIAVMPMNWREWADGHPAAARSPMLSSLTGHSSGLPNRWASGAELRGADPRTRAALVTAALTDHLAAILGCPVNRIDPEQPLTTMGIDSLMAVEIKNRVEVEWGVVLPMVQLLRDPTLASLSARLVEELAVPAGVPGARAAGANEGIEGLDRLSDDDIERLLVTEFRWETGND